MNEPFFIECHYCISGQIRFDNWKNSSRISKMKYSREKRDVKDYCNICGKYGRLTWDHVPPKACDNYDLVKYGTFFDIQDEDPFYSISQNGIKYRSICSNCNNKLLGSNYDIELINFTNTVASLLDST